MDPADPQPAPPVPAEGMIDIHSHLLPGIDDGCRGFPESRQAVAMLKEHGFVGTICTPHVWPELFPETTPAAIAIWVDQLRQHFAEQGVDYPIWPGGELRIFKKVIPFLEEVGPPTLAGTNRVLTDFWEDRWPKWADKTFQWLIDHGYQPILAHPERLACTKKLEKHLDQVKDMGVLLQGNARCFTGEDGYNADQLVRQFLREGRYDLMALDMHEPDTLPSRFDGVQLLIEEFGQRMADHLLIDQPRRIIFDHVNP